MIGDVYAGGYMDQETFDIPLQQNRFSRALRKFSKFHGQEVVARNRARDNKIELERLKKIWAGLDIRNPYLNMDKSFKNLQISKKQSEFERDVFQQGQANILQNLRGVGGGSALVQSLINQGMIASKRVSANIGEQESKNQALQAQQSERIQELERKGTLIPTQFQAKKLSLLMGMTQQEMMMHRQQELQYHSIYKKVETQRRAAKAASAAGIFGKIFGAASQGLI